MKEKKQKTSTGKSGMGFRKTDGIIESKEKYYSELEKNGYNVEHTPHGVIVTKKIKK